MSAYEAGTQLPAEGTLKKLSNELRFPLRFFFLEDIADLGAGSVSFRAMSRMAAGQRDAALAAGAQAVELCRWIEHRFVLPDTDLDDLSELEPQAAADALRASWRLGQRPIPNIVHLLEVHGVRVFSLTQDCREVDAFSVWNNDTPYVFLNTQKSAERSRHDAAHELGHLVLHRHGGPVGREAEDQANLFASAFLMPAPDVVANSPRHASLRTIIDNKRRWKTSAMSYTHRLYRLNLLSEWHYRQLCIQMGSLGYRTKEPNGGPRETSQLLRKVLDQLRGQGISKARVAKELAISVDDLDALIFGLVMTGLQGGGGRSSKPRDSRLHLV